MAKQDYSKDIEIQRLLKENSTLRNKVQSSNESELRLKEKIETLENSFDKSNASIEKISLDEINLTSNIRNEYQYEEIEELANNILKHGQLQAVLISKDNYLLAGYRRYYALKFLNDNKELFPESNQNINNQIVAYKSNFNLSDLTEEYIEELQFSENEQRRYIDHFQMSKLFNKYIEKGYEQKYICEKFNKKKSYVSSVISLKNIDLKLVNWIKEFQIYAWSKEKFSQLTTVNSKNLSQLTAVNFDEKFSFYDKNKGIIGWNILYQIAKNIEIQTQKEIFLKLFKSRLTEEEINSEYFSELSKIKKNSNVQIDSALKNTKSLFKFINSINEKNVSEKEKKYIDEISKNIKNIDLLLKKLESFTPSN